MFEERNCAQQIPLSEITKATLPWQAAIKRLEVVQEALSKAVFVESAKPEPLDDISDVVSTVPTKNIDESSTDPGTSTSGHNSERYCDKAVHVDRKIKQKQGCQC